MNEILLEGSVTVAASAARRLDPDARRAAELALSFFNGALDLSEPKAAWRVVEIISTVCPEIGAECEELLVEQGIPRPEMISTPREH